MNEEQLQLISIGILLGLTDHKIPLFNNLQEIEKYLLDKYATEIRRGDSIASVYAKVVDGIHEHMRSEE